MAAIIAPMMLQAGGIGVYIPYTASVSVSGTNYSSSSYGSSDYDYSHDLDSTTGLGIALYTNLGKESIFGYQFALEFTNPTYTTKYGYTHEDKKIEMLHTFEFGIVNTEVIKVWLGPRINVGFQSYDNNGYTRNGLEIGIAPAVGINVNLGEYFAIVFDVDYKFAGGFGSYDSTSNYSTSSGTYDESVKGITARAGVVLKFGEEYY